MGFRLRFHFRNAEVEGSIPFHSTNSKGKTILPDVTAEGLALARLHLPPLGGSRLDQHLFVRSELHDHGGIEAGGGPDVGPALGRRARRLPRVGGFSIARRDRRRLAASR